MRSMMPVVLYTQLRYQNSFSSQPRCSCIYHTLQDDDSIHVPRSLSCSKNWNMNFKYNPETRNLNIFYFHCLYLVLKSIGIYKGATSKRVRVFFW